MDKENYRARDQVKKREREILTRWDELLVLLERHRIALQNANQLMSVMRDLDTVAATVHDLEVTLFRFVTNFATRFKTFCENRKRSNRRTSAATCSPPRISRSSTTSSRPK